jgi:hypothetical protein
VQRNITQCRSIFVCWIFFNILSNFSGLYAQEIHPEVLKNLTRTWGPRDESVQKKAVYFLPRLFSRPIVATLNGQVSHGVHNLFKVPVSLGKKKYAESYLRFTNSIANPLPLVNSTISDVGGILKSPFYSTSRYTQRVNVCASVVSSFYFVDPSLHIEIAIDGKDEGGADIRFKNCQPVPILSNEPESVVIEKLVWIKQRFNLPISLFNYNCGAITKDKLGLAGLGFPIFPNLGIGNEFGFGRHFSSEYRKYLKSDLNSSMGYWRTVFSEFEKGNTVLDERTFRQKLAEDHSSDFYLQLIFSAARGKNKNNRELLLAPAIDQRFLNTYGQEKNGNFILYRKFNSRIKRITAHLDKEGQEWIKNIYPRVGLLL